MFEILWWPDTVRENAIRAKQNLLNYMTSVVPIHIYLRKKDPVFHWTKLYPFIAQVHK